MNGIIVIDKPAGWTSMDVCAKLRGVLHEKRIGHSGTLDPMATGVLPVFVGRATRAVEFAESADKRYVAHMRCGLITDTQDTTGNVLETRDCDLTEEDIRAILPAFTGEIDQIPPMYSAIKVGGKKLYELARRGETVARQPRRVTIKHIALLGQENGDFILDVTCSKGTYIRSLVADMGEYLSCGAAMAALRRTAAGAFTLDDAHTLDEVIAASDAGNLSGILRPVDSLFGSYPALTLNAVQERRCRNGKEFKASVADGRFRVYAEGGEFLALCEAENGTVRTVKSFFDV